MLKKLKKTFTEEAARYAIRGILAAAATLAAIVFGWESLKDFLSSSHSINNALAAPVYALAALALYFIYRKIRPGQPDYFAYNRDEWGGMNWMWAWRFNSRNQAEIDLQRPLCPNCDFELEPLETEGEKLLYYCVKKTCKATYETQFDDEESYLDYIRQSIMRRVRNGEYKDKLKRRA